MAIQEASGKPSALSMMLLRCFRDVIDYPLTKGVVIALPSLPSQPQTQHRLRYQLLADRRRALHEYQRLSGRILEHNPALQGRIAARYRLLEQRLSPCACQSSVQALQGDIRHLYSELVYLAKLWQPLQPSSAASS